MPYGVTPEMVEAYGKVIFDLSLNVQLRRGDPVRKLDHRTWLAEREATGLCDDEISDRVGLARPQVTFIRNVIERRVFRTNQYRKLYRLGGGKRYRPDEYVDPEEAYRVKPDAALIRRSLAFDQARVQAYVASGAWTAATLVSRIADHARERPQDTAVFCDDERLSWSGLNDRAQTAAAALAGAGVGRGDAVGLAAPASVAALIACAAIWRLGCPVLLMPRGSSDHALAEIAHKGRLAAIVAAGSDGRSAAAAAKPAAIPVIDLAVLEPDGLHNAEPTRLASAVAGDPAILLAGPAAGPTADDPDKLHVVAHTHHTVLAGARALVAALSPRLGAGAGAAMRWDGAIDDAGLESVLAYWLERGAALGLCDGPGGAPGGDGVPMRFAPGEGPPGTVPLTVTGPGGADVALMGTRAAPFALMRDGGRSPSDGGWRGVGETECRIAAGDAERPDTLGKLEVRGASTAAALVDDPISSTKIFLPGGWVGLGLAAVATDDGDLVISG